MTGYYWPEVPIAHATYKRKLYPADRMVDRVYS
jgi:hypothetical protein